MKTSSGEMRTAFLIFLVFASAAAAVSGYRTLDGDSNSREPSASPQEEMMLEYDIAIGIGESAGPPSLTDTSELVATSPTGNDGTSAGVDCSSAPSPSMEMLEALTEIFVGIFIGPNGTIAGGGGAHAAGTNNALPPGISLPRSVEEVLERKVSYIEHGRKMLNISSGATRSSSSTDASVIGCASMILRMAPCIVDFLDPSVDIGFRKPTAACCSAVVALSTSSAAGGAACACHLFRDPLDFKLDINRVDALFSACDGRHFSTGSFAKLCLETETLPPLIVFPEPASENITNTTTSVPAPVAPGSPATNTSRETPVNTTTTTWRNITNNTSWSWTSGAAEMAIVGGRGLFHTAALFLLFTAFI